MYYRDYIQQNKQQIGVVMYFIEDGPDIPDELLLARDEGRVVFFCGAGVSQGKAKLPGFIGLADEVLGTLRTSSDSPARKLLNEMRPATETGESTIEERTGIPGLLSADIVFRFLEREYLENDIECAVAKAVRPKSNVDLSAHEVLLDLATTSDGVTRLVTTNFDRLFDDCGRNLKTWQHRFPRLPDPEKPGDLNGIVYLHGRVTKDYSRAEADGFILSPAEFGRAYLDEGWASRFIKKIIERYYVVFVGYSADDPPVQYLLESLNKSYGQMNNVFAFQSGNKNDAVARWNHKGVTAISYDNKNGHANLWDTLQEWSERANNLEKWQEKIIEMARREPESLLPFEREQIVHLVSTGEGARKFLESDPLVPATWLCVLDSSIRYSKPGLDRDGKIVDPFNFYGLKSDPVPPKAISQDDLFKDREIPANIWDSFALGLYDKMNIENSSITPLCGTYSIDVSWLPYRLDNLGQWIGKISDQNAAIWWGVQQSGLHEHIQNRILQNLKHGKTKYPPHILTAWNYIFKQWQAQKEEKKYRWSNFSAELAQSGWTKEIIEKYRILSCPRIEARNIFLENAIPPDASEKTGLKDFIELKLKYRKNSLPIQIPDECLGDVVSVLRHNLEIGIQLEIECDTCDTLRIPPIIHSDDPDIVNFERNRGIQGAVIFYASLFERLLQFDIDKARHEFSKWPTNDNNVFARLRIWASHFEALVSNKDFNKVFKKISRQAFWQSSHQRDLLHVLKKRWNNLPVNTTMQLEKRILEGRKRWKNEPKQDYIPSCAWSIANRIHWLHLNGCILNLNYSDEIARLKETAPAWIPEHAVNADRSLEMRGGMYYTDTEYDVLLNVPISKILEKAKELSERRDKEFVNCDPFAGLCINYPVKAFSALRLASKNKEYPDWAWERFLFSETRQNDNERFKNIIAELFIAADDEAFLSIIYCVTKWFLSVTDNMSEKCIPVFERLVTRLLSFLSDNPESGESSIVRGRHGTNWALESLNSPAGYIVQALYQYGCCKTFGKQQYLGAEWQEFVEDALALPGDNGRFALFFCINHLEWFYDINPDWTKENLLSVLQTKEVETLEAWWDGFVIGLNKYPSSELFEILKPFILECACIQEYEKNSENDSIAGMILQGWGSPELKENGKGISDQEFNKVLLEAGYNFRACILWEFERRIRNNDNKRKKIWKSLRNSFFNNVWPIQKEAKTSEDSVRLIEFAFSDKNNFADTSELILPFLTQIKYDGLRLSFTRDKYINIIKKHPKRVLEILYTVLPEDTTIWPYKMNETIKYLADVEPLLQEKPQWIELTRRWNSR